MDLANRNLALSFVGRERPANSHELALASNILSKRRGYSNTKTAFAIQKGPKGRTRLMHAARTGNVERAVELLEDGAKVNEQDDMGCTALIYACEMHNAELVEILCDAGANLNLVDVNGQTAFIKLCLNPFYYDDIDQIAMVLLAHEANVTKADANGMTPLMYASMGHHHIVEMILGSLTERQINARDDLYGGTALMIACRQKGDEFTNIVNLLLKGGADVNITDNEGNTAIDYAYTNNREAYHLLNKEQEGGRRRTLKHLHNPRKRSRSRRRHLH